MLKTNSLVEQVQEEVAQCTELVVELLQEVTTAGGSDDPAEFLQALRLAAQNAEVILYHIRDAIDICRPIFEPNEDEDLTNNCDQLGNGCTCESCTEQIRAAVGM